jgi:hypothetical protein
MNNAPNNGSAVPKFIEENLPKYFLDRPATTEALWAGAKSLGHTLGVSAVAFFAAADTIGADENIGTLLAFLTHFHFLPVLIAAIFPALASKNAFNKAQQGVQTP